MKIEIFSKFSFKKMRKQWYFHVRGRNGEIIASSKGYVNKYDAINAIGVLRMQLSSAEIVVEGEEEE